MADARPDDLDRLLGEAAHPGPCPDENALSALSEGRLAAGERDAVLAHVAACPACSWVTGGLLEAAPAPVATPRRAPLLRILPWAAAAAVLVAAGAWWFTREPSPEPLERTDTEQFLASAAARLAREVPERFAGFSPLTDSELAVRPPEPLRGVEKHAGPSHRIVDVRPRFGWQPTFPARNYEVVLLGAQGELWRRTVAGNAAYEWEEMAWPDDAPPLVPGAAYVWSVTADDPHQTRTERSFRIATAAEIEDWHAAVAAVEARVPEPERHLVLAHVALRRGLATEAFLASKRYDSAVFDSLGARTMEHAAALAFGR